ncbi:MAG: PAS domain S-box protein, partial [Gammaproteobacteria bacterium]|nr:PAS domain S-box protein [Gammaproteobacteria bacterium]
MENKPEVQTNTPAYYPPSLLLMSVALPVCAAFYLRFFQGTWTWESDSVHALLEGVGAFAAILLALVIIGMQRSSILNPAYLCVAASLISMGLLDSFHAGIQAGQIFVWFHSLSTFFGGILFTFIVLPRSFLQKLTSKLVPFLVGGASIILAMVSVLNPELVPTMVVDNTFSATAQFLNLAGGFTFFLSAGIIYWSDKLTRVSQEKILLASHCLLFGTAGVLFKFSAMWDAVWWFWHVIRFSAYLVILWFFIDVYLRNMRLVKQNQTQSQLTASRLQTIFNNVVDGIITLDGRLSITSLNPAAEEIFLYRQKELINKNINYLIQEDAKMLLHDLVQNNDPNTQVKKVEATGIRKTGE